jgi:hypothetical protein
VSPSRQTVMFQPVVVFRRFVAIESSKIAFRSQILDYYLINVFEVPSLGSAIICGGVPPWAPLLII